MTCNGTKTKYVYAPCTTVLCVYINISIKAYLSQWSILVKTLKARISSVGSEMTNCNYLKAIPI